MEDNEIIQLFQGRDERAVKETEEKYGQFLIAIAFRILRDEEDSKECVNDALLKVWNSVPPAEPVSLKAYIAAVCRNLALDRYDRNTAKKRNSELEVITDALDILNLQSGQNVEDEALANMLAGVVNSFVKDLAPEKRMLFLDRYYRFYSVKEIASFHGMSESKVKVTLMRMRNALKKLLAKWL